MPANLYIRQLDVCDYNSIYRAMQRFNGLRTVDTADEAWCLQHLPVYTLGLAGRQEHVLDPGDIPVIKTDRGGQVTYHGPGQLVVYLMIDLRRKAIPVSRYVNLIEQSLIDFCEQNGVTASRKSGAPGVYVNGKKIAALGIRVKGGCSYHGLALNVDMESGPFRNINPCGYPGLEVTQLNDEGCRMDVEGSFRGLLPFLIGNLGYDDYSILDGNDWTGLFNINAA